MCVCGGIKNDVMKLSKQQIKQHQSAVDILNKDKLTFDDKLFVYQNWIPAYEEQIGLIASYFTPYEMAKDFQLEIIGSSIIDLCAGIGMLSFLYYHYNSHMQEPPKVTCIERSKTFVEVGKKIFPEATWICDDVFNEDIYKGISKFDCAISNPPFGKIKSSVDCSWLAYKGSEFEYKVIEVASHVANNGAFIIPQMSCPFQYSGKRSIEYTGSDKYVKFKKETSIDLEPNCGIDLSIYKDDWVGTSIVCEIACAEFGISAEPEMVKPVIEEITVSKEAQLNKPHTQLTLF